MVFGSAHKFLQPSPVWGSFVKGFRVCPVPFLCESQGSFGGTSNSFLSDSNLSLEKAANLNIANIKMIWAKSV